MARVAPIKNNFSAGEISPKLLMRPEIGAYQNGAEDITNFIVLPEGGVENRAGTKFIAETNIHAKRSRLIPFVFSTVQAYMLEFGDQYIRFYRNQGQIVEADVTITAITKANPASINKTSHGYTTGDEIYIEGGDMVEIIGGPYTITVSDADNYTLNGVDSTGFTTYTSGAVSNRIYTVASPYTEAHLDDLQFTQSADVLYITHPSHKTRKLSRTGHTSWTLANYAPTADPFTSGTNYPSTTTIYEQRLVFANTETAPQKIWASIAANYESIATGTSATDAYTYTIGSNQVNAIEWLFSSEFMLLGTQGGIFVMRGSGYDEAITPTNVQIKRQLSYKARREIPVQVQDVVVFVERLGQKIYGIGLNQSTGKYAGRDLTIRADHITGDGVRQLAFQSEPDPILWMVRDDGYLIGLSAEFSEEVLAFHKHQTDGEFESCAVIPGADRDELWVIVKRTIDGNTVRYVELFETRVDDDLDNAYFVDCGLTYDGSATDTITGLEHLEGETVTILADGATHPDEEVSDGSITLDRDAEIVHIGLGYTASCKAVSLETGTTDGNAFGRPKRIHSVYMRLLNTVGLEISGNGGRSYDTVLFRSSGDPMDAPPPLFTGIKQISPPNGWASDAVIAFRQTDPLPCTALGYISHMNASNA